MRNYYYEFACAYMAKTELYDRSLTNLREYFEPTSAFVWQPHLKRLSVEYAFELRKFYGKLCGGWHLIDEEIKKHNKYSAQRWVDEYYRLRDEGVYNFLD